MSEQRSHPSGTAEREKALLALAVLMMLVVGGGGYLIWRNHGPAIKLFIMEWAALKVEGYLWLENLGLDMSYARKVWFVAHKKAIQAADLSWLLQLMAAANRPYGYVFAGLCAGLALKAPGARMDEQFRRVHNLSRFLWKQARQWPVIRPSLVSWPVKAAQSIREMRQARDPWIDALKPIEWLRYHGIRVDKFDGSTARTAAYRKKIRAAMASEQLPDQWRGPENLPLYARALLAVFTYHRYRDRDTARQLRGALSKIWADLGDSRAGAEAMNAAIAENQEMMDLIDAAYGRPYTEPLDRDPDDNGVAELDHLSMSAICNRHGFVVSALLSALYIARRKGGILAPAEFIWLRAIDRALYIPLNNLGRQAHFVEAAGAISHWQHEWATRDPAWTPMIHRGVESVIQALMGYHDIVELEEDRLRHEEDERLQREMQAQQDAENANTKPQRRRR